MLFLQFNAVKQQQSQTHFMVLFQDNLCSKRSVEEIIYLLTSYLNDFLLNMN